MMNISLIYSSFFSTFQHTPCIPQGSCWLACWFCPSFSLLLRHKASQAEAVEEVDAHSRAVVDVEVDARSAAVVDAEVGAPFVEAAAAEVVAASSEL